MLELVADCGYLKAGFCWYVHQRYARFMICQTGQGHKVLVTRLKAWMKRHGFKKVSLLWMYDNQTEIIEL